MTELIYDEKHDIILCQETKFDQTVQSNELFPSSYDIFCKDWSSHGRWWRCRVYALLIVIIIIVLSQFSLGIIKSNSVGFVHVCIRLT